MKTKLYNLISNFYKRFKRLASDGAQALKVGANKGYQLTIILLIISFAIISPNIAKAEKTYATWNSSDKTANITLSNGNLYATANDSNWAVVRSTIGTSSGKWYWEYTIKSDTHVMTGISQSSSTIGSSHGFTANSWGWYFDGNKYNNGTPTAYANSYTNNDVIGVALDMDNGTITMYKNGSSQGTMYTGLSQNIYATIGVYGSGKYIIANFGASEFTYSVPNGYNAGLFTGSDDPVVILPDIIPLSVDDFYTLYMIIPLLSVCFMILIKLFAHFIKL